MPLAHRVAEFLRHLLRPRSGRERAAEAAVSRLVIIGSALLIVLLLGTLGHALLNQIPFSDAFYFTLITLAAIGYNEPEHMTPLGHLFNVGIIVVGIGLVAAATATIVQLMLELDLDPRRSYMERAIAQLHDHYIVCGAGRVGRHIVATLQQRHEPYVVIEGNPQLAEELISRGILCLVGDATADDVIASAGVSRAKGLVAAVGDHAVNAFIVLTAKNLNPALNVVARADDERDELKMRKIGADKVIFPTRLGSVAMANALTRPAIASYLEWAITLEGVELEMDEILIAPESTVVGQTLGEADFRSRYEVTAIAVRRNSGEVIYNPGADTRIDGGDIWILVGHPQQLLALRTGLQGAVSTRKR